MLYHFHELQHALFMPLRAQVKMAKAYWDSPLHPLAGTQLARTLSASAEMMERATRRFGKPEFGLDHTIINGREVAITEEIIVEKPFCRLLHFKRAVRRNDPTVLIASPLSGHYATLLRGTVESLLPHHNVYITDWADARMVRPDAEHFDLDSYITYLREFMSLLGPETHVIAVCQPAVPVLAAVSLMATDNDPNQPLSMTLMGGPIDTRVSKTEVTALAEGRELSWFENAAVHTVPLYYPGGGRRVYPGFLQLTGFMSMNLDNHVGSHMNFFKHLIEGDGDSAEKHRKFYNEYLSVMDIPAEFYLQTVETVFQEHLLPRGMMKWHDKLSDTCLPVRPQDIKHTALMTIEGELDDISALGQTVAAHELCYSLPQRKQYHHFQLGTGHYGIFNGRKWRNEIMPRLRHFMRKFDPDKTPIPAADLKQTPDIAPDRFNRDKHGVAAARRWLKENRPDNYHAIHDPEHNPQLAKPDAPGLKKKEDA